MNTHPHVKNDFRYKSTKFYAFLPCRGTSLEEVIKIEVLSQYYLFVLWTKMIISLLEAFTIQPVDCP